MAENKQQIYKDLSSRNSSSDNSDSESDECCSNSSSESNDDEEFLILIEHNISELEIEIKELIRYEIDLELKYMKKEIIRFMCHKNNISKLLEVKLKEYNRLTVIYQIEFHNMLFGTKF